MNKVDSLDQQMETLVCFKVDSLDLGKWSYTGLNDQFPWFKVFQLGANFFYRFFFWGRVPLLKSTTEKSGYPYSNISTGGPSFFGLLFGLRLIPLTYKWKHWF